MIKFLRHCLLISIFSFITVSVYASPKYKLVDLGLQESDQSEAVAVNDHGQLIGSYWMFGNKYYFMWTEEDGIALIDLPETATISVLNNMGQVAGNYKNSSGQNRGFVWDKCCGFTDIGTLGGSFTNVYDMNDYGLVVGESECASLSLVDGLKERHAFIWQNGFMLDLGALNGDLGIPGDRSVATSINNRGQIIGTSNSLIAHKRKFLRTKNRAVAWQNGVMEEIDPAIEFQYDAWAYSVNNRGLAVYENSKIGYFVVNLATKEKSEIPYGKNLGRDPNISDNGDIFFSMKDFSGACKKVPADIVLLKINQTRKFCANSDSYEYVYFADSFENPKGWMPNSFQGANGFNKHRTVVGTATNIYGEHHAVLLAPIIE